MEKDIIMLCFLLVAAVGFAYTLVVNSNDYSTDIYHGTVTDAESTCFDSDGGQVFEIAGYTTMTNGATTNIRSDYCKTELELIEFYCDGKVAKSVSAECNCLDSACAK
jgi:hypothetical protein